MGAPRARADGVGGFIPLAEETGIVQRIDEFVLDGVMHQIVRWREPKPELTVSVNVSAAGSRMRAC